MKTKMKYSRSSLFLGFWLALAVMAATIPGYARSTTGFNSFHILGPASASSCVYESYGAVVNGCSYPVSLAFDMPVDNTGEKTISVWDSNVHGALGTFTCQAISFPAMPIGISYGTELTFNPVPIENLVFYTNVTSGDSITLYCFNVPTNRSIATLNWTP